VKTDIGWALEQDFISDGEGSDDDLDDFDDIDNFHQPDELYDDSDDGRLPERRSARSQRQERAIESASQPANVTKVANGTSHSPKHVGDRSDEAIAKRARQSTSQ
ncbi:MAG: hypothetical protein M1823_007153, partial [Watsoniomyces obsoletus]